MTAIDVAVATPRTLARRLLPLQVGVGMQGLLLWVPIEKLFQTQIGFDAASIGVMAAAYAVVVPLLEVPSGILADRWSRSGILVVSSAALTPLFNVEIIGPIGAIAILTAVGRLAATRAWRVSLPVAAVVLVVLTALAIAYYQRGGGGVLTTVALLLLAMACTWTVGNSVRQRQEHVAARRADETERAVAAERLRIARELHDLIAHSMGVIAIQAGVAITDHTRSDNDAGQREECGETFHEPAETFALRTVTQLVDTVDDDDSATVEQ